MNSLFVLHTFRSKGGTWVFDDPSRSLKQEPFVGETNILIDFMAYEHGITNPDAFKDGVELVFSDNPFPGNQVELLMLETSPFGTTYRTDKYKLDPWLCPAFFLFYSDAPTKLYGMVNPIKQ